MATKQSPLDGLRVKLPPALKEWLEQRALILKQKIRDDPTGAELALEQLLALPWHSGLTPERGAGSVLNLAQDAWLGFYSSRYDHKAEQRRIEKLGKQARDLLQALRPDPQAMARYNALQPASILELCTPDPNPEKTAMRKALRPEQEKNRLALCWRQAQGGHWKETAGMEQGVWPPIYEVDTLLANLLPALEQLAEITALPPWTDERAALAPKKETELHHLITTERKLFEFLPKLSPASGPEQDKVVNSIVCWLFCEVRTEKATSQSRLKLKPPAPETS